MKCYFELKTSNRQAQKLLCSLNFDFSGQSVIECRHSPMNNSYLDIKQSALFTGLSKQKLYLLVSQKRVPHVRIGRRIFFIQKHLWEWLKPL
jgi:predicted DNA-binding transcriptional regulator AlpA